MADWGQASGIPVPSDLAQPPCPAGHPGRWALGQSGRRASPEEGQGAELGEKVLLLRRADWFLGQRGLRELMFTTFPGGVVDCSSWAGLAEAMELAFDSGA